MTGLFDEAEIPVSCPECNRETIKTIGWIRKNKSFVCLCGNTIELNSEKLRKQLEDLDRITDSLNSS